MGNILITKTFDDYELLDSGDGEKLERYGGMVLSRPDPQVLWAKSLPKTEWGKADAVFLRTGTSGKWKFSEKTSKSWQVSLNNIKFNLELLPSKHLGVFPEQSVQWEWLEGKIKNHISSKKVNSEDGGKATAVSVLNLFGYTGGAT
ncbi:MAG: class I SAM-dependent rRNA methyltransferase, partial [Nitrospira sp.]